MLPSALISLSLLFSSVEAIQLRTFHRFYFPNTENPGFSDRGTVTISQNNNSISFQPSPSFRQDLSSFSQAFQSITHKDSLLYQVALEHPGDTSEAQWDISSVKACHLHHAVTESLYLHTLDVHNPNPYAIDYFVSPVPHGGACPKSGLKKKTSKADAQKILSFESLATVNTTVILKGSHFPPLPQLAVPPPMSPEGQPVVPVPEKSFLQKYWLYIVAILVLTLITGGPEEEKQKK